MGEKKGEKVSPEATNKKYVWEEETCVPILCGPCAIVSRHLQVVRSLRSRHANLLRLQQRAPPRLEAGSDQSRHGPVAGATEPAVAGHITMMPVRLVTNGLWPVVAKPLTGPAPVGSDRSHKPETGGAFDRIPQDGSSSDIRGEHETAASGGSGGGESGGAAATGAAFAAEVAELFDSVSVALNTADASQYEEVRTAVLTWAWGECDEYTVSVCFCSCVWFSLLKQLMVLNTCIFLGCKSHIYTVYFFYQNQFCYDIWSRHWAKSPFF